MLISQAACGRGCWGQLWCWAVHCGDEALGWSRRGRGSSPISPLMSLNKSFSLFRSKFSIITNPSPGPTCLAGINQLIGKEQELKQSGYNGYIFVSLLPIDFFFFNFNFPLCCRVCPVYNREPGRFLCWDVPDACFLLVPFMSCLKTS